MPRFPDQGKSPWHHYSMDWWGYTARLYKTDPTLKEGRLKPQGRAGARVSTRNKMPPEGPCIRHPRNENPSGKKPGPPTSHTLA
eukprot:9433456-Pyramimonas_sp.AAC.2